MEMNFKKQVNIVNRKAKYEYEFLERIEAGIQLQGTELKSIRLNNVSIGESFCFFKKGELYVSNLYIGPYEQGTYYNHEPRRERKLLLKKRELRKWMKRVEEKGLTIVPYRLYFSERGFVKLEIVLGQGKKIHDKRASIKERDTKRELDRLKNIRL